MASRRIPEEISQFRPGPCTEIKLINGHYYVYTYEAVKLSSGKWGKKTGKSIGSIIPGKGFVPNRNYSIYKGEESADEITILEYGQYALTAYLAGDILKSLEKHFTPDRAVQIFSYACILFANGFVHLDQVQSYYEQSWLSHENRMFTFSMGKTALGTLLDDLGRKTKRVEAYEQSAINGSSAIAIDGHAIRSCSDENDLGEAGYKFRALNEDQVNILMGYDINTHMPLFTRMFRGSCNDRSTIKDIAEIYTFSGILFVIDRGFYSKKNLEAFSMNGNIYVIPVPSNTDAFKAAMTEVKYDKSFYYTSGTNHSRIEYTSKHISDKEHVYVFRDIDENEKCRYNYLHSIELGKSGYTKEKFETNKEVFGVYVLQTNSEMSAEEVFKAYKIRWSIENFYQYLKNEFGFNDLMIQDYYKKQGMAFIALIAGQIHQKVLAGIKTLNNNTISVKDIMLMARCMKIERRGNNWNLKNTRKRDLDILKKLGFSPLLTVAD